MPIIQTTKEVWDSKDKDRKFWLYVDEGSTRLPDGTVVIDPWTAVSKGPGFPHKAEVHVFEPGNEIGKVYNVLIYRVTWQKSKIMPELDQRTLSKKLCWGISIKLVDEKLVILPPPEAPAPIPEPVPVPVPVPEPIVEPPVVEASEDLTDALIEAYSNEDPEQIVKTFIKDILKPEPEPKPKKKATPKKKKTPPKKRTNKKKEKIPELKPIKEKKAKKKKPDLSKKTYPQLQTLAIKHGIKGNQKRAKLIKALEKVI